MNKISVLCLLSACAAPPNLGEPLPSATATDTAFTLFEEDSKIAYCFTICAPTAPIDRERFDLELDLKVTLDISQSTSVSRCEDILATRATTSGADRGFSGDPIE